MSSLFGILSNSRQALSTQRTALGITGTNIANVNTEGYSRQTTRMETLVGGSVKVGGIDRLRDQFLEVRMRNSNARMMGSSTLASSLQQMEQALSESEDQGLSKSVQDFMTSLQNLASKPGGVSERESVRAYGEQLSSSYSGIVSRLEQIRSDINLQLNFQVERINDITESIAKLNKEITQNSNNEFNYQQMPDYNNLLDQRDGLVDELSEYMSLHIIKDSKGSLTIFGADEVLVENANSRSLSLQRDESNDGLYSVMIDKGGAKISINDKLKSGSLGGLIEARDGQGRELVDSIERMAAQLIRDFNQAHRAGTGLDGQTNLDFFTGLNVNALPTLTNSNGSNISGVGITDQSALTFDDYEIRFTSPGTYDVVNTSTDTVLAANNAYVSGGVVSFDGMQVSIADVAGGPVAGDTFKVNSYAGTAGRMDVAPAIKNSIDSIAAGETGASGDNRNTLAMVALFDNKTMGEANNYTFEEYYDKVRLQLAMDIQVAEFTQADEEISQQQISGMMNSISGVSIDEEATNIIQFQRAFQAASRVINATDELMQTIINMI